MADNSVTPEQQAFIDQITAQVQATLSQFLDGNFEALNYPNGFHYHVTYGQNQAYNLATLEVLDSMLSRASNGMLQLTGQSFSTRYSELLKGIQWGLSNADQATKNREDAAAQSLVNSVVTAWTNSGRTWPSTFPTDTPNKLEYVIAWTDKWLTDHPTSDPATVGLGDLFDAVNDYQNAAGDSAQLSHAKNAADTRRDAAGLHVTAPSATNGALPTDPGFPPKTFYPAYSPDQLKTTQDLIDELGNAASAVTVSISLSSVHSKEVNTEIGGSVNLTLPIEDIFTLTIKDNPDFKLFDHVSDESTVKIDMLYQGVTLVSAQPAPLSGDNKTGWYDEEILKEAIANTGKDATGYRFAIGPQALQEFGEGCAFSRLKTFVISQQPTITMKLSHVTDNTFKTTLSGNPSVEFDLFGIFKLGSEENSYKVQTVDSDTNAGTVKITFAAPPPAADVPEQAAFAYVLGGVASYPPVYA